VHRHPTSASRAQAGSEAGLTTIGRPAIDDNLDTASLTCATPAEKSRRVFNALQAELPDHYSASAQRAVSGTTHGSRVLIQEHPQLTSAAIVEVARAVRTGGPIASAFGLSFERQH